MVWRAVDVLKVVDEPDLFKMCRAVISKIFVCLRQIGVLINSVFVGNPKEVSDLCTLYFNLYALCFVEECNSTVWTLIYMLCEMSKDLVYNLYFFAYEKL
jgi:hypothetical protein